MKYRRKNIIYVSLVNQSSLTPTLEDVGAEMPELKCFYFSLSSIKITVLPEQSIPQNEQK